MYLLDVNVLIALGDANHVHHRRGRAWFLSTDRDGWATCPITENGVVRILGHSTYPDFGGEPEDARQVLNSLTSTPGHQFWSDDLSICDNGSFPRLSRSGQITDLYLLALAIKNQGSFATLDQRIDPDLIPGGAMAYFLIP